MRFLWPPNSILKVIQGSDPSIFTLDQILNTTIFPGGEGQLVAKMPLSRLKIKLLQIIFLIQLRAVRKQFILRSDKFRIASKYCPMEVIWKNMANFTCNEVKRKKNTAVWLVDFKPLRCFSSTAGR